MWQKIFPSRDVNHHERRLALAKSFSWLRSTMITFKIKENVDCNFTLFVNFVRRSEFTRTFVPTHTPTHGTWFFSFKKQSWEKNLGAENIVQLTVSFGTFINDGQGTRFVKGSSRLLNSLMNESWTIYMEKYMQACFMNIPLSMSMNSELTSPCPTRPFDVFSGKK